MGKSAMSASDPERRLLTELATRRRYSKMGNVFASMPYHGCGRLLVRRNMHSGERQPYTEGKSSTSGVVGAPCQNNWRANTHMKDSQ